MEKNFVFIINGRVFLVEECIDDVQIPVDVTGETYEEARGKALEIAQTISRGYNDTPLRFYFRVCNK